MGRSSVFNAALIWLTAAFFCFASVYNVSIVAPDAPHNPLDEAAHLSYAINLITQHRWWPDFNDFPFYFANTTYSIHYDTAYRINYLNHPPTFYWLAKLLSFAIGTLTLWHYRAISILFVIAAMAAHAATGTRRATTPRTVLIYAMLPFLLYVYYQMSYYNNDAMALLGGAIATYASIDWFEGRKVRRAFSCMLLGLAFASVKLTALMLVGGYVAAGLLLDGSARRALKGRDWAVGACVLAALVAPYLVMALQWGSPAPTTPGQLAQLSHPMIAGKPAAGMVWTYLPKIGWAEAKPLDFLHWLERFILNFADQSIGDFNCVPLLVIPFCFAVQLIRTRGLTRPPAGTDNRIACACMLATIPTLIIHMVFSWGRYQKYGWMIDSFVRYYFPLLSAYGITCIAGLQQFVGGKGKSG